MKSAPGSVEYLPFRIPPHCSRPVCYWMGHLNITLQCNATEWFTPLHAVTCHRQRRVIRTFTCELDPDSIKNALDLTEFNWIATPSPNCVGNPGWHRTRKPLAYRVSCYTLSPHLNIPRSFKIVIYLILEHIYTSSMNTFPWQSIPFIYRSLRKCILSYV